MFSQPDSTKVFILHGEYSAPIVILSILIACFASFTALSMNERIQQNSFFHRSFWRALASIAMGLGIWSMHFIGMSAYMLPLPMKFDLFLTILSMLPAVFSSYIAFVIANSRKRTQWSYVFAGMIMGIGIAAMHYVGMAAMKMDAQYTYKPWIFLASIGVAIIVSYIALYVFSTMQRLMGNWLIKVVTSLLMGGAVATMHYIGMEAVIFYTKDPIKHGLHEMQNMDMYSLILGVTIGIFVLFIISGLSSFLDRYVDYRLTYFDPLTLMPNRRQFEKKLEYSYSFGSLAVIHLHNLEQWNSRRGYMFGDNIIKVVADIIIRLKPESASVYRIEGNRFAIFTFDSRNIKQLKISMERIASILMKPIEVENQRLIIEMVCAISTSQASEKVGTLFLNTIAVLQHSTIEYNHEVIEYDPTIHTYALKRNLVHDIDRAIRNNELFLVYQPKISSHSKEILGVEALLRWNHPIYGHISPGIFIPILEEYNKMYDVTDWVINQVCYQISKWIQDGISAWQVAINIPGPYVTSPRLMNILKESVTNNNFSSSYLELEITETSVINNIESAIKAIEEFREFGFSVALDDFGTGVSSLSYLKRLPITTLKIDKSFVDGVPNSEKDSAIVKAIITLCHSLNLKVVIEGVESKDQVLYLRSMSENPTIQGYFFTPPLREGEFVKWAEEFQNISNI
ncbi:bifunctional diguanylate cyclase/phosphodiesterase [Ferdinandcohnia quinoae]|uniref:EAL domain-containing protein n=1 Tax=Fredinandcohnia quinoae TaxID=2918902 RepID=A0AAW5E8T1_9BACI|nr:EAL domain-containing protein [Fredinandcohnia sp. SECRCQ15]MCH1626436.1 EAL domain-containing protein [Fredinandcohnia sp. SECRCQ15]